jgi:drug/metabolite transporter (DMT)-like permease
MIAGGFLLTINDAIQKWMTDEFPTGQLLSMRGLFVLLPIGVLVWRAGGISALRINRYRGQSIRAGLVCLSSLLFLTALSLMPLADAIALTFVGPLFITALAPFMLGEIVGWHRWLAVLLGFVGVVIMVQPSSGALQWVAVFPLGVALCGALRDIVTRHMHATESTVAIMFYSVVAVILFGFVIGAAGWRDMSVGQVGLFAINGIVLGTAYFFLIEALRHAEASVVSPFKYVSLLWAIVLGQLIWGDIPGAQVLIGAVLIIASGWYILHREAYRRNAA